MKHTEIPWCSNHSTIHTVYHYTQYIYWEHAQFEFRLYPLKKYKNTVLLMFIHFINTKLTCIKTEINVQEKSVKA